MRYHNKVLSIKIYFHQDYKNQLDLVNWKVYSHLRLGVASLALHDPGRHFSNLTKRLSRSSFRLPQSSTFTHITLLPLGESISFQSILWPQTLPHPVPPPTLPQFGPL